MTTYAVLWTLSKWLFCFLGIPGILMLAGAYVHSRRVYEDAREPAVQWGWLLRGAGVGWFAAMFYALSFVNQGPTP